MVTPGAGDPRQPIRIVFFGTPQFAVPTLQQLIASRHEVVGVVTQPDRPRGRGQKVVDAPVKAAAVERGLPVFQPHTLRDPGVMETLTGWQPDLGVVAAYGRLLSERILSLPRLGMVNVHASLLPKYRGAAPVHRAVIDGEPATGVTIMRMVKQLDAGAMFDKVTRPIGPDETSDEVERGLASLGAALLLDVVEKMLAGTALEEPQDDSRSTYAPRLTKEEGLVDWSLGAAPLHNRVRGLYPWPHAYTYLDGKRLILLKTRVGEMSSHGAPGTIVEVSRDGLSVATGDGRRLVIEMLQPEGKRPMQVREFLAGRPIHEGARFEAR